MEILPNVVYVVTKGSKDGTFEVGDHFKKYADGILVCLEAQGFISEKEIPEAIIGMECMPEFKWVVKLSDQLDLMREKIDNANKGVGNA